MAKLQWRNEQSHRRQEEGGWEDEGARYLAVVPLTALVRSTRLGAAEGRFAGGLSGEERCQSGKDSASGRSDEMEGIPLIRW